MKLLVFSIILNVVLFGAQIVPIHKSWQMIGISGDLPNLNDFNRSEIKLVWAYNNNTWSIFSSQSDLQETIGNFNQLSSIPKNSSIWILSDKTGYMKIDANRSNNTHINLNTGWQMIGTDIGWSSLKDFNRSEVDSIWMYDGMNRKWKAFSPESQLSTKLVSANIDTLKNIPANRGFWIHANSDFSIDTYKIKELNITEDEEVAPTPNAYDYNADGTAFLKIKQEVCNNWENAFNDENFTNADIQTKIKLYKNYVYQALEKNENENQLIYAPRGKAGDFNLTIEDDAINLIEYKLPGDLNGDGNVTDEDINTLTYYLAMKDYITPPQNCDVDNNGVIDHRDLLYVGARLMTQVATFDIYTTDGQKLSFPSISWTDKYTPISSSDSSSLPSTVRVIARDENGASTSKENEITKNEWYKSFVTQRKVRSISADSCGLDLSTISQLFATPESKYVIGFSGDVRFIAGQLVNRVGKVDNDLSNCATAMQNLYLLSHTHKYFVPTDMDFNVQFGANSKQFAVLDGFRFNENEIRDIKMYNKVSKDIATEVHGYNKTIKQRFLHNGKYINTYAFLEINAIFKESYKKYPMHGEITRNTSDKYQDCGQIRYDRYGPAQQKDSESTNLQRVSKSKTKYNFEPKLSMGHYHASIVWPKGGEYLLENDFIVKKDENEKNFDIPWSPDKIKGHLYDPYNKPLDGKQIVLRSTCDPTLKKYYTTKEDGSFEFKDVDIGEYEILVDNKPKATVVQPGYGAQSEIKDKPLWRVKIDFSNSLGSGSVVFKKLHIDCEETTSVGGEEVCTAVFTNQSGDNSAGDEKTTIKYSGSLHYDPNLSPLFIFPSGIEFDAYLSHDGINEQVGSTALSNVYNDGLWLCAGKFPSGALDKLKNAEKIFYHSQKSYCTFTLEPCKNDSCEDKSSLRHDDFDDFDDFDTPSENENTNFGPGQGLGE